MTGEEKKVQSHVAQTIQAVLALQAREEENRSRHQRAIESVSQLLGRPRTVYLLATAIVGWAILNVALISRSMRAPDPPPFEWMQAAVSSCALLMTVVVLTAQNRQSAAAERRGHLDLQVNLLAEQKVAKLIALVEELRRDLPIVPTRRDSLAEAMKEALDPDVVAAALDGSLPIDPAPSGGPAAKSESDRSDG